mgnify:CR=1 FL=1
MTPGSGLLPTRTLPRKNLPDDFGAAQSAVEVAVNAAHVAADFKNSRRFIGLDMFGKLINTPDDPVLVNVVTGIVDGLDGGAVTDDGDLIGNIGDLIELMGNNNTSHTLGLQALEQIQKVLGVFLVQSGSGFICKEKFRT